MRSRPTLRVIGSGGNFIPSFGPKRKEETPLENRGLVGWGMSGLFPTGGRKKGERGLGGFVGFERFGSTWRGEESCFRYLQTSEMVVRMLSAWSGALGLMKIIENLMVLLETHSTMIPAPYFFGSSWALFSFAMECIGFLLIWCKPPVDVSVDVLQWRWQGYLLVWLVWLPIFMDTSWWHPERNQELS